MCLERIFRQGHVGQSKQEVVELPKKYAEECRKIKLFSKIYFPSMAGCLCIAAIKKYSSGDTAGGAAMIGLAVTNVFILYVLHRTCNVVINESLVMSRSLRKIN